ncbi:deoxyribose-phosphate aldolase, partial [uncultured Corynebacterium sp.]|uniref:deoxyribose-phosphate aldolase n=1 Tax=uncultured Corynebacterium sp. TaxID=159447 RepID=UPI002804ECD3
SGAVKAEVKAAEAARAVADGAEEVDMVINIAFAKEHRFDDLEAEIKTVRDAIPGKILKVIIESAALTDEEIIAVCKASESAGADFVKTSTGFHPAGGASAHAVKLMRETVGDRLGVKASGGIRDAAAAEEMIAAGASRLGLSSSAAVLDGLK